MAEVYPTGTMVFAGAELTAGTTTELDLTIGVGL